MDDKKSGALARKLGQDIDDDEEDITPQNPPPKEKEAPNQFMA